MRAIGGPLSPEESQAFIAAARSRLGCEFRHMGRGPKKFDCAGLLLWSMQQAGRPIVDIPAYDREPHRQGLEKALVDNLGAPVPLDTMQGGDVLLMRFEGQPKHVGVLWEHPAEGMKLVHTYGQVRRVIEHGLIGPFWRGNIVAIWRP
jgi:cell wall-associated NlpC family hydrolase